MQPDLFLRSIRNGKLLYHRYFADVIARYGISQTMIDVLLFLTKNPNYDKAQEVSELRGLAKSNVSAAVEELVKRGMLRRLPDENNRRVVHLAATEQAKDLQQELLECQQSFFSRIFAGVSEEERLTVTKVLEKIENNLEEK